MNYDEERALVETERIKFQGQKFGLRAFPGRTFRVCPEWTPHFYLEGEGVQLVVEVQSHDGTSWQQFGRNTPEFIRANVTWHGGTK